MAKITSIKKKIERKLRWKWNDVLTKFGRTFHSYELNGSVRVLCFHGICLDSEPYINSRFLTISKTEALFLAFKEHFNVLSLDDYLAGNINQQRPNLLLTFDDGYQNNVTLLVPLLEKFSFPATIFCTTQRKLWMDLFDVARASNVSLVSLQSHFPALNPLDLASIHAWAIRQEANTLSQFQLALEALLEKELVSTAVFHELMNDEALAQLQSHPLVSIANHGAAHLSYANQDFDAIDEDWKKCRDRLERIGSPYSNVFAYPFGHFSTASREQLTQLGVTHQFGAYGNWNVPTDCIDRVVINPYISVYNQLIAIRDGGY